MICRNCGNNIEEGFKVCDQCGTPVEGNNVASQPNTVPMQNAGSQHVPVQSALIGAHSMVVKKKSVCDESRPYIFISYAHKDAHIVLRIVNQLIASGFNVWWDEGIDPGTEWDENIALHVRGCSYFIAFISQNYVASKNCKDELNYSRDLDKEQFLVYIEEAELPYGMQMRMNRIQSVFWFKYDNESDAYSKLYSAKGIDVAHLSNSAPANWTPINVPAAPSKDNGAGKNGKKGGIIAIIAIVAVLILGIGGVAVFSSLKGADADNDISSNEESKKSKDEKNDKSGDSDEDSKSSNDDGEDIANKNDDDDDQLEEKAKYRVASVHMYLSSDDTWKDDQMTFIYDDKEGKLRFIKRKSDTNANSMSGPIESEYTIGYYGDDVELIASFDQKTYRGPIGAVMSLALFEGSYLPYIIYGDCQGEVMYGSYSYTYNKYGDMDTFDLDTLDESAKFNYNYVELDKNGNPKVVETEMTIYNTNGEPAVYKWRSEYEYEYDEYGNVCKIEKTGIHDGKATEWYTWEIDWEEYQ